MSQVNTIRTLAINAKDLSKAEKFYAQVLGAQVTRRIKPTEEQLAMKQLRPGWVKEVDVQLGNLEVHIFDASNGQIPGVPHHTLNLPWQEKQKSVKELEDAGARLAGNRDHHDGKGYSLYVEDPDGNRWELSFR